jgi:hypothetical protein
MNPVKKSSYRLYTFLAGIMQLYRCMTGYSNIEKFYYGLNNHTIQSTASCILAA